MPSFKALSLIATFAFAAFTNASPMAAPISAPMPEPAPYSTADLAIRSDEPQSLPQIFTNCHASLEPLVAELTASLDIDSKAALDTQIKPVVLKIKAVIKIAIKDAQKWQCHTTKDGILIFAGVQIDIKTLARLLCAILELLFFAIRDVLHLVGVLKIHVVLPLLCEIADLVAELLTVVFGLVDGLLAALLVTVGKVASIILFLGVPDLIFCLGGLRSFHTPAVI